MLIMHTHTTETYELEEKNWCDPAFSARSKMCIRDRHTRSRASGGFEVIIPYFQVRTSHNTRIH